MVGAKARARVRNPGPTRSGGKGAKAPDDWAPSLHSNPTPPGLPLPEHHNLHFPPAPSPALSSHPAASPKQRDHGVCRSGYAVSNPVVTTPSTRQARALICPCLYYVPAHTQKLWAGPQLEGTERKTKDG